MLQAMMTTLVKVEVVTKDVFVAIMMMMMVEDLVQLTSKWIYLHVRQKNCPKNLQIIRYDRR